MRGHIYTWRRHGWPRSSIGARLRRIRLRQRLRRRCRRWRRHWKRRRWLLKVRSGLLMLLRRRLCSSCSCLALLLWLLLRIRIGGRRGRRRRRLHLASKPRKSKKQEEEKECVFLRPSIASPHSERAVALVVFVEKKLEGRKKSLSSSLTFYSSFRGSKIFFVAANATEARRSGSPAVRRALLRLFPHPERGGKALVRGEAAPVSTGRKRGCPGFELKIGDAFSLGRSLP